MASFADLVTGRNRHVCVYAHDFPGYTSSQNYGDSINTVSLTVPSDLNRGYIVFCTEGRGSYLKEPSISADWSSSYMLVYEASKVAGKTLSCKMCNSVGTWTETGGGDNTYRYYGTSTTKARAYYSGYKGEYINIPNILPSSNISTALLNAQLRRIEESTFSMDDELSRLLAKKPSGLISFEDYKNKRLVECRLAEIYYVSGGGYGSGTSYGSWTTYKNTIDGFGVLKNLNVFLQAAVIANTADSFGIEIYLANKQDNTKCIHLSSSYSGGGNSTGTYTLDRNLTEEEIATLGGYNTELVWKARIWGNSGSGSLVSRCCMILTPEVY